MSGPGTRADERGTSIAEVMVVVALLSLVALPILATLRSATRAEDRIGAGIDDTAALRRIQQLWLADVRTGTLSLATPPALDTGHVTRLLDTDDASIEWRRTEDGLERRVTTSGGVVTADVVLLTADGLDPDPTRHTFSYVSALGAALDPTAVAVVDACAATVTLALWEPDRADPAFALTAAPRVDAPEEGCP